MIIDHHASFALLRWAPLSLLLVGPQAAAQQQPATIPTVVAQATGWMAPFEKPRFFDRLPPGWPATIVPAEGRTLGGSIAGDSVMFRARTAVFAFPAQADPHAALQGLLARAGYVRHEPGAPRERGGFVGNTASGGEAPYCSGSTIAMFGPVDSVQAPRVFAVMLIDGEAGRQTCNPRREPDRERRFPVEVPMLSSPAGAQMVGGGSSAGDGTMSVRSALRTSMPADSVLSHYARQLESAGWTAASRPSHGDGIDVQRFNFRQDGEDWIGVLIVVAVEDRREIRLEMVRRQ